MKRKNIKNNTWITEFSIEKKIYVTLKTWNNQYLEYEWDDMNKQLINKRKRDEYEGTVSLRSEYRKYRSLALTQNINKNNYSVDDSELE